MSEPKDVFAPVDERIRQLYALGIDAERGRWLGSISINATNTVKLIRRLRKLPLNAPHSQPSPEEKL